jgi:hypothetical protein
MIPMDHIHLHGSIALAPELNFNNFYRLAAVNLSLCERTDKLSDSEMS